MAACSPGSATWPPPCRGTDVAGESGLPSEWAEAVLDLVEQIPRAKVLTYGDVAQLLPSGGPRAVGTVLARFGSDVPWWRVVRAGGHFPQCHEQRALEHYRAEGTPLVRGALDGGRVDLSRARWEGPVEDAP